MSAPGRSRKFPDEKIIEVREDPGPQDIPDAELDEHLSRLGVQRSQSNHISWRKDASDHPRNWSPSRKIYDTTIIILLEFYTTVISTTGPSAANSAGQEYGVSPLLSLVAFSLLYQLGQAFGGLIIPPYSESFGRRIPYLVSSFIFAAFCLIVGLVPSVAVVFISRFITGFASAVPSVVIAGSIEDMFNARSRVWLVFAWNALTTLGLVFGPIYGAYIDREHGWRWIYISASIGTAFLTIMVFFLRESRPSLLLHHKIRLLHKSHGLTSLKYDNHDAAPTRALLLQRILIRPARLLTTEPLVILIASLSACSWGTIYLFTASLPSIYLSLLPGFTSTTSSLPFLAIGVGVFFSIFPRFYDAHLAKRRKLLNQPLEPEDKLTGFSFAVVALIVGLWIFAWCVPPAATNLSWAVPTLALVLVGFAVNELAYTLSGYLADSYTVYAASAFAGLAFLRAVVSGVMPLVAYELYGHVNANVAGSVVAGIATVFGVAPVVLHRWSRKLRLKSEFARYSFEVHARTQIEDE
ncbi:MAG: hypothetical protein M1820_002952 [Bogoriella megaspora]|nr:MAG: hypothetical protein M1820_002952 [Bogoriella megaspora]